MGKLFVVVAGEFKQGKSSLLNAFLNKTEIFSVDIDITTNLVSTITYGKDERVSVVLGESGKETIKQIAKSDIPDYVTEQRNVKNAKQAKMLTIESPNPQLKEGLPLQRLETTIGSNDDSLSNSASATQMPELSTIARELIKLRDWILLAQQNQPEEETEVLSAIDCELKKNLQQEGVISIEETGLFDCERQKIIATKITNDAEKSDRVCNTVRSGYLFNDRLIRPQEAIVYLFCPPENEEVV